ncbi:MAG: polyprenyl diphosphate synthase [Planctomycetaceae bacterium]
MASSPAGTGVTSGAGDPPEASPPAGGGMPRHVAVIMDGNGRWAQRQGLPRIEGHRRGVATVRRITEHCARLGIGQLTLYCLSSENWRRPPAELSFLMHLLEQYMIEERALLMRQGIRLAMIGRRAGIPDDTLGALDRTIELCATNVGMRLCLAINYGARAEIADAARSLARDAAAGRIDPDSIDEDAVASRLDTAGMVDPDLLIRTAGEMRISNFLLWQISYAELWVTPVCWPEFEERHLDEALASYASRDRRFGGLAPS